MKDGSPSFVVRQEALVAGEDGGWNPDGDGEGGAGELSSPSRGESESPPPLPLPLNHFPQRPSYVNVIQQGQGGGTNKGDQLLFSKLIFCTRRPFRVDTTAASWWIISLCSTLPRCTAFLLSFFFFLLLSSSCRSRNVSECVVSGPQNQIRSSILAVRTCTPKRWMFGTIATAYAGACIFIAKFQRHA